MTLCKELVTMNIKASCLLSLSPLSSYLSFSIILPTPACLFLHCVVKKIKVAHNDT